MSPPLGQKLVTTEATPRLEAQKLPEPSADGVVVQVDLAGICRTDLSAATGKLSVAHGTTLGHEAVGHVVAAGARAQQLLGRRTVVLPIDTCGHCADCRGPWPLACLQGRHLGVARDGAFATWLSLPASHVIPIDDDMPDVVAAQWEPASAALAVTNAGLAVGQLGVIVGSGRIAELTRRAAAVAGFDLSVMAPGELPAAPTFDFAIETTACHAALGPVMCAVRAGGTVVLKSRPAQPVAVDVQLAVRRNLTLRAVGWHDAKATLRLLQTRQLVVADLAGPVFSLDDWPSAFALATSSEAIKVFLSPRLQLPLSHRPGAA